MDINAVIQVANKNKKEAVSSKSSRYTTDIRPAKKLPRSNVNPKAIQSFLDKQKQDERTKLIEARKKKGELHQLRLETKSMKKVNAMSSRTKDNLKVYKGEDILGLYAEPKRRRQSDFAPLSPEAERRHREFVNDILHKVKLPGYAPNNNQNGSSEPGVKQDEKKLKKLKKIRAKARSASNLDFNDLLQLAEKQKNKVDSSSEDEESSDGDSGDDSDDNLTAEERYQEERKKRKKLEEQLKLSKSKHKKKSSPGNESSKHKKLSGSFKIGKLDAGLTEESKRAKVKALMAKIKNKSSEERPKSNNKTSSQKRSSSGRERTKDDSYADSKTTKSKFSTSLKHKHPRPEEKPRSSKSGADTRENLSLSRRTKKANSISSNTSSKQLKDHARNISNSSSSKQSKDHARTISNSTSSKQGKDHARAKKYVTNPYKQTVVKQSTSRSSNRDSLPSARGSQTHPPSRPKQSSAPPTKCTLSVTSESVKTNYPGIARLDPYVQTHKRNGNSTMPKLTLDMVARYKAALMRKVQQHNGGRQSMIPQKRRYGVIEDDDDEYDSELDDFIVDGEDEQEMDVSSQIKAIFGYDRTKYGRESEWELSRMEASYKDIEKEEKKSLKIAKQEDALEAKLEEERIQRRLKGK